MENNPCNSNNAISITLCQFEAWCNLQVIYVFLKHNSRSNCEPIYGDGNGFSSFISPSMILDDSVYIYEAMKLCSILNPESTDSIENTAVYSDLKEVRNNIHIFYKRGGYYKKANTIISEKRNEFEMDEPDISYPLRNDISLVYYIHNKKRCLIGSDYFFKHCIFETEQREWEDNRVREFAEFVSATISGFSEASDETAYNMTPLPCANDEIRIELFDYKSADLFARVNTSKTTVFRLLLTLSQISYGILLVEYMIDKESAFKTDLWVCFLTKILALKYDEAFDNLSSLLTYSDEGDRVFIKEMLKLGDIDISNLNARQFAQELRNTIHYQEVKFDINLIENDTTASWIKGIYLSNSTVKTMDEFRILSDCMLCELKLLQRALQVAFGLDKVYSFNFSSYCIIIKGCMAKLYSNFKSVLAFSNLIV